MDTAVLYVISTKTDKTGDKRRIVLGEVYIDGYRIGFIKQRGTRWLAAQWRHSFLGYSITQIPAVNKAIDHFEQARSHWTSRRAQTFIQHAAKLSARDRKEVAAFEK